MSRVKENAEMRDKIHEAMEVFANSALSTSDQTAISIKVGFILGVLTDISTSLAVIADNMEGGKDGH